MPPASNAATSAASTPVTQLDEMTQRNAALVVESASAATTLDDHASQLNRVVGAFDLGRSQGYPA